MAINKDSNGFTFLFSTIMVIVVGALLAFLFLSWKPMFDKNDADKKMMDVLAAINVESDRNNAEELFKKYVKESIALKFDGTIDEETDGFKLDVKKNYKSGTSKLVQSYKGDRPKLMEEVGKLDDQRYPLFIAEKDGEKYYVMPMVGTGLWGPIWGYVSVGKDFNTIYGASFDHKTETPGLGAEIKESFFEEPFQGQQIYNMKNEYVSISVEKGGAEAGNKHQVDGITGGTITSNGVDEMLYRTIKIYTNHFNKIKGE
ncbi:MAG: NADH:ubiquinone reductase (Na(+)-transporting) subunit C [Bacteroidota bacterium]